MSEPLLTVVVPAHNEQATLANLVGDISHVLEGTSHEVVIVDDGSTDGTWSEIQRLSTGYASVRGVRLTRNFGHQPALLAGLAAARGSAVVTMDADGQHPADLIPVFLDKWHAGAHVVQGLRTMTEGETAFKRWTSRTFYALLGRLGGPQIPPGAADFRLMTRPVVAAILESVGSVIFLRGLVPWLGYPTTYVPFEARRRSGGRSSYTTWRMFRFSVHGLMSFSAVPLRLSMLMGFGVAAFSFLYLLFSVAAFLVLGRVVPGWASVMGLLSLLGGIQLIMIGVVGEYVGRIFLGQLNRPPFVVLDRVDPAGR